jgi:lysozyme family protein
MVFTRSGGGHVAFFERESDSHYYVTGGNQSDTVSTTAVPKGNLVAMRWPSEVQQETSPMPSGRFEECLAVTLKWEGGHDDDPRDPGGRTSRGILQSEWNDWRQSRPGLPSDVWQAPQDQIVAIYKEKYWDRMLCDQMPAGVDLAVFDFGVNSGRGVREIQDVIRTDADGEVGPLTLAALSASPPADLIAKICDARMKYLRSLPTWGTFGRGWTNRVNDVRAQALAMATLAPPIPVIVPVPAPLPIPTPIPPPTLPSGDIPDYMYDYERVINFISKNADDLKLLFRVLRITPSGAPTAVSVAPVALPSPEPSPVATALSRPSVVGGASLTAAAATAQATGALPMPTDLVTALPLLIPAGTALVGSLGGWGALAGIAANVFSAMAPKK